MKKVFDLMLPANMRRSIFTPIYGLHFRKSRLSIQKQKQESFERNFIGKYHATSKEFIFNTICIKRENSAFGQILWHVKIICFSIEFDRLRKRLQSKANFFWRKKKVNQALKNLRHLATKRIEEAIFKTFLGSFWYQSGIFTAKFEYFHVH